MAAYGGGKEFSWGKEDASPAYVKKTMRGCLRTILASQGQEVEVAMTAMEIVRGLLQRSVEAEAAKGYKSLELSASCR